MTEVKAHKCNDMHFGGWYYDHVLEHDIAMCDGYNYYIVDSLEDDPTPEHLEKARKELFRGWDDIRLNVNNVYGGIWLTPGQIPLCRPYYDADVLRACEANVSITPVIFIPRHSKAYSMARDYLHECAEKTKRRDRDKKMMPLLSEINDNDFIIRQDVKGLHRLQRYQNRLKNLGLSLKTLLRRYQVQNKIWKVERRIKDYENKNTEIHDQIEKL